MTTGPAEPATAKELKKQLRRLKHVGNGSSSEAAALEERLKARETWEKDVAQVKGSITEKSKLLPNADVSKEIAELQTRYKALTGESDDYKAGKKRKAPSQDTDPMTPPPDASTFEPWAPRSHFRFEVLHESKKPGSRARVGRIHTPHGVIDTPCFVPVGTNGALKAVRSRRPAVRRRLHAIDATRFHLTMKWVVSFSTLRPFGPRRVTRRSPRSKRTMRTCSSCSATRITYWCIPGRRLYQVRAVYINL